MITKPRFFHDYGRILRVDPSGKIEESTSGSFAGRWREPITVTHAWTLVGDLLVHTCRDWRISELTPNYLDCVLPSFWRTEIESHCADFYEVSRFNQFGNRTTILCYTRDRDEALRKMHADNNQFAGRDFGGIQLEARLIKDGLQEVAS